MLSEKEKKEFIEDAYNTKIREAFQRAEKKYLDWVKQQPEYKSLDNYITFLNSIQKIFGPLSISKEVTPPPHKSDFRL